MCLVSRPFRAKEGGGGRRDQKGTNFPTLGTPQRAGRGGGGANWRELTEGVGGTFGRLLFNTAPSQELLDCNHSKAHSFKKERE